MKINKIFNNPHIFHELAEKKFNGIHFDSRKIKPDQIFLAIKASKNDGHHYVKETIKQNKAIASIVNWEFYNQSNEELKKYLIPCGDTIKYAQKKARTYLQTIQPQWRVAITGTNGKTTTKELLSALLSSKKEVYKSHKNFNNELGIIYNIFQLPPKTNIAIFEIGTNHPGEIAQLSKMIQPNIGIITNIGYGHIEHFRTLENIAEEKTSLFKYSTNPKLGIINADDPILLKSILKYQKDIDIHFVSHHQKKYQSTAYKIENSGIKIKKNSYLTQYDYFPFYSNLALAVTTAQKIGLSPKEIQDNLQKFKIQNQRMEVKTINGITVINDCYNANPDSMKLAINTSLQLSEQLNKKIIFLLGDMLELGKDSKKLHQTIGEQLKTISNRIEGVFTFGEESQFYHIEGKTAQKHFNHQGQMWEHIRNLINKEQIITIKGSRGMRMEFFLEKINEHY